MKKSLFIGAPLLAVNSYAVDAPSVKVKTDEEAYNIEIRSMDNGTIINNVVVNRGNCEIYNPATKAALLVAMKEADPNWFINSQLGTIDIDRVLDKLGKPTFPTEKIPFGETWTALANCDTILEVKVTFNGKTHTYKLKD